MVVKVSIVIPAYNAEKEIRNTVDSILNQTFIDYEIIVVNDGSTDNTLQVLLDYGDKIKIIDQVNGGVSKARNEGIKVAEGEYVAFLDSDDLWHPDKLSLQIKLMESNTDWNASYTLTSFDSVFVHKTNITETRVEEKTIKEIFNFPYLVTSSFVIKCEFCKAIGAFNEDLATAEDIDLYLRTSVKGAMGYINEPLTWKADIQGSLGSALSSYKDNLFVVDKFLKENPEMETHLMADIKRVKANIYNNWGKDLLWNDKALEAIVAFIKGQMYEFNVLNLKLILKSMIKSILLFLKIK